VARSIRLGLVFGSRAIRDGRKLLLGTQKDFDIVYEAEDGALALEQLTSAVVDVVLIDNRLRNMSGIDLIRKFIRRNLDTDVKLPAFVLTGPFASPALALEAVRSGADDLVTEDESPDELITAIRGAANDSTSVDVDELRHLFAMSGVESGSNQRWLLRLTNLTDYEQVCLDFLRSGLEYEEIPEAANLSVRTVRSALDALQQRLGLATREQLTLALYEAGVIPE
jgi:DNA-binding NarL/FixJ family response regulator